MNISLKNKPTIYNEWDAQLIVNYAQWLEELQQMGASEEMCKEYKDRVDSIKEIKGMQGYSVLEDGTILCDPYGTGIITTFDGCQESEARSELYAMMRGY